MAEEKEKTELQKDLNQKDQKDKKSQDDQKEQNDTQNVQASQESQTETKEQEVKPEVKKVKEEVPKAPEERRKYRAAEDEKEKLEKWKPQTLLGKQVKNGEITEIEDIFNNNERILEAEIVNYLIPDLEEDLLLIGQAKGKFGGGQRRIFRQTQKKTMEGNKIKFLTCAVVGNKNGFVGVSIGKSKETVPARDKSKRKAKLNLMRIRRGCGSWECNCGNPHSIPFAVTGKCGSSTITLMPAPKGKGLCVEKECAKILALAGIKDVWSKTEGQTKVKLNLVSALMEALKKLSEVKVNPGQVEKLGIVEGKMKEVEAKPIATNEEIMKEAEEVKSTT